MVHRLEIFYPFQLIYAYPQMPKAAHGVKRQAYAAAHYITGSLTADGERTQAAYHFMRSIMICPFGCQPTNRPRQWGLMLNIVSAPLTEYIHWALRKIRVTLKGK